MNNENKKYSVVAFLAREVGLNCLESLASSIFSPELVLTHKYERKALANDKNQVRNEFVKFQELAKKYSIPLLAPTKEEFIDIMKIREYDFLISVNSAFIFPPEVFNKARIAAVNLHPSVSINKEIKYRGGSPLERAIENEDERVGVSIHKITESIDGGEVFASICVDVEAGDKAEDLYSKLMPYYPKILINTLFDFVRKDNVNN